MGTLNMSSVMDALGLVCLVGFCVSFGWICLTMRLRFKQSLREAKAFNKQPVIPTPNGILIGDIVEVKDHHGPVWIVEGLTQVFNPAAVGLHSSLLLDLKLIGSEGCIMGDVSESRVLAVWRRVEIKPKG